VDFVTGSTRFGSSLSTSTHQFTGSVSVTGSLAIASAATYALDVTGTGRFTSTLLVGGAATFSSDLTSLTIKTTYTGSSNWNSFGGDIFIQPSGANNSHISDNMYYNGGWLFSKAGAGAQIYFGASAAGSIDFRTAPTGAAGGTPSITARMTILQGGNVGIGITPSAWASSFKALQVGTANLSSNGDTTAYIGSNWVSESGGDKYITTNAAAVYAQNSGAHIWYTAPSGTAGTVATFTERMRITSGGYLKATTTGTYEVSPTGLYYEFNANTTTNTFYICNINAAGSGLSVNINNSSDSYNYFTGYSASAGAVKAAIYTSGKFGSSTSTYGSLISDARLKENIIDATPKLNDILKLRVVNFNLIGDETKQIGFIAQEFKEVFPSLISVRDTREFDNDGKLIKGLEDTMSVNVGMDFAILTKVIQEMNQTITSLQDRLDKLESK
jgi:hypothetical protein